MKKDRIKVIIEDMRRIPTIGKGPIRNPIFITKDQFNLLKLLGYNVIVCDKQQIETFDIKPVSNDRVVEEDKSVEAEEIPVVIEDEIVEVESEVETLESTEVVEETATEEEEVVEELVEEEITEEVVETEVTLDIDKLTKKELKAELDAREVKYAYNANVEQLREALRANL